MTDTSGFEPKAWHEDALRNLFKRVDLFTLLDVTRVFRELDRVMFFDNLKQCG